MRLLGYPGWLLRCCYAVAKVPGWLLRRLYAVAKLPGWLLGCCFGTQGGYKGVDLRLLGYPGWLLRCCYAVAKVLGVVAKLLLCGC